MSNRKLSTELRDFAADLAAVKETMEEGSDTRSFYHSLFVKACHWSVKAERLEATQTDERGVRFDVRVGEEPERGVRFDIEVER